MRRVEAMLAKLLPGEEGADDESLLDEIGGSSTLKEGDGFTTESSSSGQGWRGVVRHSEAV